jgi:hypothetical protein
LWTVTAFFVPGAGPEQAEARYEQLAEMVAAEVVRPTERVLSLRFVRGAEEWTATVGEPLSGQLAARTDRRAPRGSSSPRSAPTRRVTDPATVQAVFRSGESYLVVTDSRPVGPVDDSTWDNPFSVPDREAREVVRFGA